MNYRAAFLPAAQWNSAPDFSFPDAVHQKIARYQRKEDRDARWAARALARDLLHEFTGQVHTIVQHCPQCGANDHGQAQVAQHPELQLSWSHSGHWVAAIVADSACGIDVQTIGPVPDAALHPAERDHAHSEHERSLVWAKKEALLKAGLATIDSFAALDTTNPPVPVRKWAGPNVVGAWVVR